MATKDATTTTTTTAPSKAQKQAGIDPNEDAALPGEDPSKEMLDFAAVRADIAPDPDPVAAKSTGSFARNPDGSLRRRGEGPAFGPVPEMATDPNVSGVAVPSAEGQKRVFTKMLPKQSTGKARDAFRQWCFAEVRKEGLRVASWSEEKTDEAEGTELWAVTVVAEEPA